MPTQTRRRWWYDHASAGAVPMEVGIGRSGSDRRPVPRSQLPQDRRWPVTIDRGGLRRGDKEEVSVLREAARKMHCHCGIFCQYFKTLLSFSYSYRLTVLLGRTAIGQVLARTRRCQYSADTVAMEVGGAQAGIEKMPRLREYVTPHRWSALQLQAAGVMRRRGG